MRIGVCGGAVGAAAVAGVEKIVSSTGEGLDLQIALNVWHGRSWCLAACAGYHGASFSLLLVVFCLPASGAVAPSANQAPLHSEMRNIRSAEQAFRP